MNDRKRILAQLPDCNLSSLAREPVEAEVATWEQFIEQVQLLGGEIARADCVEMLQTSSVFADEDFALPISIRSPDVWQAEAGACVADFVVARSGTLVIESRAGRSRLTSLAPPVNIVDARKAVLVASLEELFPLLNPKTNSVFISGTSRTADIEGILVRGVHGPKRLIAITE